MDRIDEKLLDKLSQEARDNERLRMNYNLHQHLDDKVQRLLNALEPGTEIPIHRHRYAAETYILLRGRIKVYFYNANKELQSETLLDVGGGCYGIHIPAGQWHALEVLESGSVIFEVKEGPYTPLTSDDIL
jgi:cupin fold WbuC family metalloprotein